MVNKVTKSLCCAYLLAAVLCACHAPPQASSNLPGQEAAQTPTPQPSATPEEVNPLLFGVGGGMPRGDEAWRRFMADGRYRIARASDFNFPEAARQSHERDLVMYLAAPYVVNDIDRDYRSRDAAVIVVDTTRNDAERFGLVIFTEPEDGDGETVPEPFWLYRDRDLSRTFIGWNSEGMNLRTYRDDGTYTVCYVKWERRQQRYFCNQRTYNEQ